MDDGVAEILHTLDATGLSEDTLVVLTGDHGESLTEHDIYFEHHGLYDQTIHVPLLMRLPGKIAPGTSIAPIVQHLDLAPTLLNACGASAPEKMEGQNLWPLATGQTEQGGWEQVICCESTWQSKWCCRTNDTKFILSRQPDHHQQPMRELYDLTTDPAENVNLAETRPEQAAQMEAELEEWIAQKLARAGKTEDPLLTQGVTLGKRWEEWVRKGRV